MNTRNLTDPARTSRFGQAFCAGLVFALLACAPGTGQAAIAVAGGQITPVSAPGAGYVNDNSHPFPFMVFLPNGYSSTGGPYPLVVCLHGNGEVGNGSSDGTLTASSKNQLAYLFGSGPLPLIRNGSTYFGDKGVIVVQPQSDLSNGSAFNPARVDLTMRHLLGTYRVDRNRIYTMGLSAGGGGIVRYAYSYAKNANYQLAVIVPFANIQGLGTTYTDFSKFTGSTTWFVNSSDDGIAPVILSTGRIWSGYGAGIAGGISRYIDQAVKGGTLPTESAKGRCLTTHPDLTAIAAGGFNDRGTIPATQLSNTYTGRYNTSNASGWTWVPDQTFTAGSNLQITIRKGGGHSGWSQTMGSGSSPSLPFWNWLLAQRLGQTPTGYTTAVPGMAVAGVNVSPTTATLSVGQTRQFTATAVDQNGTAISPQPAIVWSSGSGGSISAAGLFTATSACATITVTAAIPATAHAGTAVVTLMRLGTVHVKAVDTTKPRPPYGYVDYLPQGYDAANQVTKWPLVIYLPNITESGDGTNTPANGHQLYSQMVKYGPLYQVERQHWDFPAIIIAPQVTTNWAKPLNVKNVVEYAKTNYRVDDNRIYMTGNLEGASGTLRYAVAYPGDLAAILPIEANTTASAASAATIKSLPVWAVHSFANQTVARSMSIGWVDALAVAENSGTSDVMATYPGYGGDRNHFAADSDPVTGKPLNPNGAITSITAAKLASGSSIITFPTGVSFGSSVFGMWGGSDAQPFARVSVAGNAGVYTSARSYASSLTLTAAQTGPTATATVTIQTPVGYNVTAYRNTNGSWGWNRNQTWDQVHPDQQILTLFYYQNPADGWNQTWANWNVWNWLFDHARAPVAAG